MERSLENFRESLARDLSRLTMDTLRSGAREADREKQESTKANGPLHEDLAISLRKNRVKLQEAGAGYQ